MASGNNSPFLEQVETFFVNFVRRGLMLRPSDIAVIKDWEVRGVPLEVVRRGVVLGVARFLEAAEPHEPVPATIKYYRTFVEKEFEAYKREMGRGAVRTSVVSSHNDLRTRAISKIRELLATVSYTEARLLDRALQQLEAERPEGSIVSLLEELEDALAKSAVEKAPHEVRSQIEARLSNIRTAALRQGIGEVAIEDIVRAEMRKAALEIGCVSVINSLLGPLVKNGLS